MACTSSRWPCLLVSRVVQRRMPVSAKPFPTVGDVVSGCVGALLCRRHEYKTVNILTDVTSVLEPSNLYLILGPPNASKTSFLKAISGTPA